MIRYCRMIRYRRMNCTAYSFSSVRSVSQKYVKEKENEESSETDGRLNESMNAVDTYAKGHISVVMPF